MADIHIHRDHQLGLPRAREIALAWAEELEQRFDMSCTLLQGDEADTLEFSRSGVKGQLLLDAQSFELSAKLGMLMGAFKPQIEAEIGRALDQLLASEAGKA